MRVGIVTVQVPFISGGAELLATGFKDALLKRKIDAEIITIPFKPYPPEILVDHIKISRLLDLSEIDGKRIDKIITLKFPAYFCHHKNKSLWLLHQHRSAYDLYGTPYGDLHLTRVGNKVVKKIKKLDNQLIPEHESIYAISHNVAKRLKSYNQIQVNEVLYPPANNADLFKCEEYGNFIIYASRFTSLKRQELIVQAMQLSPKNLKLILIGDYQNSYGDHIKQLVESLGINDRVILKNYISEEEKIDLYSRCLAVYNGVLDEDYGYVTIEAFLASKPVIVHPDAGGPLEFVIHEENGFIVEPTPLAIAELLQKLVNQKNMAITCGENGRQMLKQKNVCWDYVIDRLI